MEADLGTCPRCKEDGETTPLTSYYLNLHEVVCCCSRKQCSYHQNARLSTSTPLEEKSTLQPPIKFDYCQPNLEQPMLQWSNRDSLCWLDVTMSLLVNLKSLRECINKVNTNCIIKELVVKYNKAMSVYCRKLIDDNRNLTNMDDINNLDNFLDGLCNDSKPTCLLDPKLVKLKEAVDILNDIRNKLFEELQPRLNCDVGSEDGPLFALLALLDKSKSFAEHFLARYHLEFNCALCGHIQITSFQKSCISFQNLPSGFDVNRPVMMMTCPKCKATKQQFRLIYHKLSQCLIMQFVDGLPHNNLDQLQMYIDGCVYKLTAVVQYKPSPKHFVVWIKDVQEDVWMECDDLKLSECKWSRAVPNIPANQIHMIVLERQHKQCINCFKQADYVNSLMHSTVLSKSIKLANETVRQPSSNQGAVRQPSSNQGAVNHPSSNQGAVNHPSSNQGAVKQSSSCLENMGACPTQHILLDFPNSNFQNISKPTTVSMLTTSQGSKTEMKGSEDLPLLTPLAAPSNQSCRLADLPKPAPPIVLHTPSTHSMNKTKFLGFQESKKKNKDISLTNRNSITDNVLLDKYLNTCVKDNIALNTSNIRNTKAKSKSNKPSSSNRKKMKLTDKKNDAVSVVMATIPDRLLSQACTKNRNLNRTEAVGRVSGTQPLRRRARQFNVRQKTMFPSYGHNAEDNVKLCNGFSKKSNIDSIVPSPNPSVESGISSSSDLSGITETHSRLETDTPSECSIDSQGDACLKKNVSLLNTSEGHPMIFPEGHPMTFPEGHPMTFPETALLETNQDDFFSSLLETDFTSLAFM